MANPYSERRAQMFPSLNPAQIARIEAIGKRRDVTVGEVLFQPGEQNGCFFVVLSGAVEVTRPLGDGEVPVTVHHAGDFTGEINMLSARRSLVRGRVVEAGTVLVVDRDDLRLLV